MSLFPRLAALLVLSLSPSALAAHHGSAISYDTSRPWTTWVTVTSFNYKNPHPSLTWDRMTKDGQVEHWTTEMLNAPAPMTRAGWTRARSEEAVKPGTRVKVWVATARAGGTSGIVMRLENEKGEEILARPDPAPMAAAVDLDGVPMGLQPSPDKALGPSPGSDR